MTEKPTPWGLPSELLRRAKTQTDPIHDDIYWTRLELLLIDSEAMQRLRHVKQLGMTLKVYPGAEHSRFTHLLGTVAAAQKILDKIEECSNGPHSVPSLLDQWRAEDGAFELRWQEATVLARLASLIHDLTHVPFGHTIEDDLEVLIPHDRNEERFNALWALLPDEPRQAIEAARSAAGIDGRETSLFAELRGIVLDKVELPEDAPPPPLSPYPFVADVVNNTICADLLDYIERDHYFLGLPFAVGDRFMDAFFIVPSTAKTTFRERLVVRLSRDGEARRDVRTELLKFLRYRYEETERALYHKTKLGYDAMLGKMLEMWKDQLWYERACEIEPELGSDPRTLNASTLYDQVKSLGDDAPEGLDVKALDQQVRDEVEEHFRFFGDEGLLEHLIWDLEHRSDLSERQDGILELARRIRYRDHFRLLGQASGPDAVSVAAEKYALYRSPASRRDLEVAAARFAGVNPAWRVILWVPSPRMRLKIAEVLVTEDDNENLVRKLANSRPAEQDGASGDPDAALIVNKHMGLWAIRVYTPAELRQTTAEPKGRSTRIVNNSHRLLGYIQRELGLPLRQWDGQPVPSLESQIANELGDERRWNRDERAEAEQQIKLQAARAEHETYDAMLKHFRAAISS